MAGRDTVTRASREANESVLSPRTVPPDVLLLERPSWLDRVQVGRVWRQEQDTDAFALALVADSRVVMRGEVVHHDDIPGAELGQETCSHPLEEPFLVRRREHGRQNYPARQSDRAQCGEIPAPIHWDPLDQLMSPLYPRMASGHRQVEAGFIEKHQPLNGNAADRPQEGLAPLDNVGAQTFQRPSALFFTT
jgi:hypothetical protein